MELAEFKVAVDGWLDEHEDELAREFEGIGTLDQQMAQLRKVMRLAYDAGFMRMGWPERVGGLGRLQPAARLSRRGADRPRPRRAGHLLDARGARADDDRLRPRGPGGRDGAAAAVAARRSGARGSRSRAPGATSPRSTCRATRTDEGWRVNGQKVWTSLAQYAQRCVLLTRTGLARVGAPRDHGALRRHGQPRGSPSGRSRRCTASRSSARSSTTTSSCRSTACSARSDGGWSIAMDLLALRAQHRAVAPGRLPAAAARAAGGGGARRARSIPAAVGEATQLLWAFRARSRATQRRLAAGETLGPETSIDKVLVATAEQAVFDLVAEGLGPGRRAGRRPGERALAGRVPLLAGGHHLRRQRRDPAQHHRPAAPRPRGRPLMDDGRARALRARRSGRRPSRAAGEALDAALAELGWLDALAADRGDRRLRALRGPGGGQRRRHRRSTTCWPRAGPRRRRGRDVAVVLPPLRAVRGARTRSDGDRCSVRGPGTGGRRRGTTPCWSSPGARRRRRGVRGADVTTLQSEPVRGIDPALGPRRGHGRRRRASSSTRLGTVDWDGAVTVGQLALGHELVGAARAMLELARAARAGPDPVRAADQLVPGGAAPSGREPGRARGGGGAARRGVGRPVPGHARPWPRGWPGRSARTVGPPLPAGAGGHRLHGRAPVAPLRPAGDRARPAARRRQRADPPAGGRRAGDGGRCRPPSRSEARRDRADDGHARLCFIAVFDN